MHSAFSLLNVFVHKNNTTFFFFEATKAEGTKHAARIHLHSVFYPACLAERYAYLYNKNERDKLLKINNQNKRKVI